jgi:elongation factor Ts
MNSKLGTLVGFNKVIPVEAAKDIAMQVAAMNPVSVTKEECPQSVIDKELQIGREKAIQEGKPENMVDKIAQGMLNKFFKESTLMEQAFIKEAKQSVADYLKSVDPEAKVVGFVRFSFTD